MATPWAHNALVNTTTITYKSRWSCNLRSHLPTMLTDFPDTRVLRWDKNRIFIVKSFYNLLNDVGLRCLLIISNYVEGVYGFKIKIFNWLTWDNKILILDNFGKCECNKILTLTCLFCHHLIKSVDHLFLNYHYASRI